MAYKMETDATPAGSSHVAADLHAAITSAHADNPQRGAAASIALAQVEDGLRKLAALGHHLVVALGGAVVGAEWPKVLYHDRLAPQGQVFDSEEDVPEGPGWRATPQSQDEAEA